MKAVYDINNKICKSKTSQVEHIKDSNGSLLIKENYVNLRWIEHFNEIHNRPEPALSYGNTHRWSGSTSN